MISKIFKAVFLIFLTNMIMFRQVYANINHFDDIGILENMNDMCMAAEPPAAILELLENLPSDPYMKNMINYGLAVKLNPYVGKGYKLIDYYFGVALAFGSATGSDTFYKGLAWMDSSGLLKLKYPGSDESFKEFAHYYIKHKDVINTYFSFDGFWFFDRSFVILVPSIFAWERFKQDKLSLPRYKTPLIDIFDYDENLLKQLLLGAVSLEESREFIEGNHKGCETEVEFGRKIHGFRISTITFYERESKGDEVIGKISVRAGNYEIYESFKNEKLQPLIDFIENVMKSCGLASSVNDWLIQIREE